MKNSEPGQALLEAERRPPAPGTEASAPEPAIVDPRDLLDRVQRLRRSGLRVAIYSFPPLFVLMSLIVLFANWRPDHILIVHIFVSLFNSAGAALICSGAIYFAMFQMARMYESNVGSLAQKGRLVQASITGPPIVYGGPCMSHVVGGVLGFMWEPLAPRLGKKLPLMLVSYSFEVNGKKVLASEFFYTDEEPVLDESGSAWVLVDPKVSNMRRWLVRQQGTLEDCPFAV